jgi:hypothetical protein
VATPSDVPTLPAERDTHGSGAAHVWVRARESANGSPEDDWGWRHVAGFARTNRDTDPSAARQLLLDAYEAYCTNPLAYAILEQSTNFDGAVGRADQS